MSGQVAFLKGDLLPLSFLIQPQDLIPTGNLEFLARQVVEGFIAGLHKSPFHGFSAEFAEHRIYNPGESIRYLDWKLFARSEKLFIKKYEEETNLRCLFLIDTSPSMYYPGNSWEKIKFAALGTATLMHLLKKQRDAMGLTFFSDRITLQTEIRSSGVHHRHLLGHLEKLLIPGTLPGKKTTDISETLHLIAEKIHRRSLVVIFSDMFEPGTEVSRLFEALQHLKFNKHEVILFHTTFKPRELDFNFENRPYLFEDLETGERVKLLPGQVRESYTLQMEEFTRELVFRCAQYHIHFVEADVSKSMDQVLIPFLVKRQKMRG